MIHGLRGGGTGLDVGNVLWQEMIGKTGERDVLNSHGQVLHTVGNGLLAMVAGLVPVVSDAGHSEVLDLLCIKPGSLCYDISVLVKLLVVLLYLVHQLLEGQVLRGQVREP